MEKKHVLPLLYHWCENESVGAPHYALLPVKPRAGVKLYIQTEDDVYRGCARDMRLDATSDEVLVLEQRSSGAWLPEEVPWASIVNVTGNLGVVDHDEEVGVQPPLRDAAEDEGYPDLGAVDFGKQVEIPPDEDNDEKTCFKKKPWYRPGQTSNFALLSKVLRAAYAARAKQSNQERPLDAPALKWRRLRFLRRYRHQGLWLRDAWARSTRRTEGTFYIDVDQLTEEGQQGVYRAARQVCAWLCEQDPDAWSRPLGAKPRYRGTNVLWHLLVALSDRYRAVQVSGSTEVPPSGEFRMPDGAFGSTFGVDGILKKPWYETADVEGFSSFAAADLGLDPAAVSRGDTETRRVIGLPVIKPFFKRQRKELF